MSGDIELIFTWVLVLNIDIDIDIDIDIVRGDINNQVEVLLKQVKQESLNIRDAQGWIGFCCFYTFLLFGAASFYLD